MALDPVNPQQIPTEFIDMMSSQLLLQPDADYLWARSAYSSNLAAQMESGALLDLVGAMQRDHALDVFGARRGKNRSHGEGVSGSTRSMPS